MDLAYAVFSGVPFLSIPDQMCEDNIGGGKTYGKGMRIFWRS